MTEAVLEQLARTLDERRGADPEASYTAALLAGGDAAARVAEN